MPNIKAILLGAALALPLPAAAQDGADTVLAVVNGKEITLGHVIAAAADLPAEQQGLPDAVLLEGLTERLVQQAALSETQDELAQSLVLRLENERRALIASELVEAMASDIEITDTDLKAAYDDRYADFEPEKEYNASHILVATEEEAQALVTELEGGADFAELAKEKSTGPSGPGGGNLGWFARGAMVEAFQDAVETLDVGAVSDPVETQFGWHVIKLNETRIPDVPAIDDVTNELRTELFRDRLGDRIDAALAKAEIERAELSGIDPAAVRDLSLISE